MPLRALALLLVVAASPFARAQGGVPDEAAADLPVDAKTRALVIERAIAALTESYVFPDVAGKMEADIRSRLRQGEYDAVASARAFAALLTDHLQALSRDKHLRLRFSPEPLPPDGPDREPSPEERARFREEMRSLNYGFERAERLPGNIGYLDLRAFMDAREGGATAAAAMAFLANTNALIVDIRRNGGGGPEMVALVSSYLFDERVHLNSLYWREGDRTDQFWTTDWVPGPRFGGSRPVYVLTSGETFSAAEEFAYNLQTRKRATIVGETTGGGAHPGGPARLTEHFRLFIPRGRAINPVTGDNWEGRGVKPDVPVPATDALRTARVLAMRERLSQVKDAELKGELERLLRELEAEVTPRPTRGNGG